MSRKKREKLLQFVDDLQAHSIKVLTKMGVPEPTAKDAATDIAQRICAQYGRSYMYVPTDLDFKLAARDVELWVKYGQDGPPPTCAKKYSRDRVEELAEEYELTSQQMYCILRLMHRQEVSSRQGVLPGLEETKGDKDEANDKSDKKGVKP